MRFKALMLALAFVMAAAGCSSSEDTTTTTSASGDTTGAETTTTGAESTTTTAAESTTTTAVEAAGGPDCLVGTWALDSEQFLNSMRDIFLEETEISEVSEIGGSYTIVMSSDGTLSGERDEWGFSLVSSEGTVNISMSGSETGTWSATDDQITIQMTGSDVQVSVSVVANGQEISIGNSPVDIPDAIANNAAYSCEGDVLTVESEDFTTVLNRA
jgi:hypothetical protein